MKNKIKIGKDMKKPVTEAWKKFIDTKAGRACLVEPKDSKKSESVRGLQVMTAFLSGWNAGIKAFSDDLSKEMAK